MSYKLRVNRIVSHVNVLIRGHTSGVLEKYYGCLPRRGHCADVQVLKTWPFSANIVERDRYIGSVCLFVCFSDRE